MVFRASWGSLGPLLGALGGFLGTSWAPDGCSGGSLGGFSGAKEPYWAPLGCSCCPSSRLFSFDLLRSRCFSCLGASLGRFWVHKMTLRLSKTLISCRRELVFRKRNLRFRPENGLESVLALSWASSGRSWWSPGGLLGSFGVLLGVSWGLLGSQGTILGSSRVLLLSFFSVFLVRSSSKSFFVFSWGLLWSILGFEDDSPTLKNRAPV